MLKLYIPRITKSGNAQFYTRLFSPLTKKEWLICEYDNDSGLCFGLIEDRLEYFYIQELEIQNRYENASIQKDNRFRPILLRKFFHGKPIHRFERFTLSCSAK